MFKVKRVDDVRERRRHIIFQTCVHLNESEGLHSHRVSGIASSSLSESLLNDWTGLGVTISQNPPKHLREDRNIGGSQGVHSGLYSGFLWVQKPAISPQATKW